MIYLAFVPFVVQFIAMCFDEYYFHIKRGLPLWERIGHPLDTLSVLLCLGVALFIPYSPAALKIYIGLSILSCLMVTKDEFMHKHHCPVAEHWLHSLLFINHPIILTSVGVMWMSVEGTPLFSWLDAPLLFYFFILGQTALTFLFMFYQIIFWNFLWKEKKT